jgi:S1-C subfamily serine protease
MNESAPAAGTPTVLSGYPLAGLDLVSQTGNVAGTGIVPATLLSAGGSAEKSLRILVSVVSNPGNSGGPVLNDRGELIGILEGNWQSPVKDETGAQAVYLRPKKDALGNVLKGANGNPQVEMAGMLQNSGISFVVPARLIVPLLKQAQAGK